MSSSNPLVAYINAHSDLKMPERIAALAAKKLMLAIASTLPQEQVREVTSLVERGDDAKLLVFLDQHIENPEEFVDIALTDLRKSIEDLVDIDHESH